MQLRGTNSVFTRIFSVIHGSRHDAVGRIDSGSFVIFYFNNICSLLLESKDNRS